MPFQITSFAITNFPASNDLLPHAASKGRATVKLVCFLIRSKNVLFCGELKQHTVLGKYALATSFNTGAINELVYSSQL